MNLIDEMIQGVWVEKAAKSANFDLANLARNQHVNFLTEFNELFSELALKTKWIDADYTAWEEDLKSNPKLTIECLRALKRSWDRGAYGVLEQIDWREL
jgi:hypothetical protein